MQFSSLYVALMTAVMSTQVLGSAQTNFGATCSGESLASGHILFATCGDGHGGEPTSSIDLNKCVTNSGGTLECQVNGGFAGTCNTCSIESGTTLACDCGDGHGGYPHTVLNLNNCLSNKNGQLTCP
ncbi:Cyanovirin-N [Amylostereum chailletii]|nr:Cyanovirin-N [Amylostereum chailletii]